MKERQISARQLDYSDTRLGSRAGISPRAGSPSPTHVDVQSCEGEKMMYIMEKVAQKKDKMMNLALSEMFKECLRVW